MNLYIQSEIFLFFHLPITIFLFFLFGEKFKQHIHWLLITSIAVGAFMQVDNKFSIFVLLSITIANWLFREQKKGILIFNIMIWIIWTHSEFIFNWWAQGDKQSYQFINILNINVLILMLFFLNQIYLLKTSSGDMKFSKFLLCSLLPLITIPAPLLSKKTNTFNALLTKDKMLGFNFFNLALIFNFLFITPFEVWVQEGIHAGFSLNIVQAWALFIFNSASIVFNLIYILLISKGCSVVFGFNIPIYKSIKAELNEKIISPYNELNNYKKSLLNKSIMYILIIILFLSLKWYQIIFTPPLLTIYYIFRHKTSGFLKYINIFILGLIFLILITNTFIELKVMLIGLLSLNTLFMYYTEYYILHGFNSEPLTALILIILTTLIFKNKDWIYAYTKSLTKYSYLTLLIYPLLALIQLS